MVGSLLLLVFVVGTQRGASAVMPQFGASGPHAAAYGGAQSFPVGNTQTWNKISYAVGSYSHFDATFRARGLPHPRSIWNF
jgi:hypothetical protein